jgi:translation initiation factor IF-3
VLSHGAALRITNEEGLDLVEVAPQAAAGLPPDGLRTLQSSRPSSAKDQRRKQKRHQAEEMKLRPKVAGTSDQVQGV